MAATRKVLLTSAPSTRKPTSKRPSSTNISVLSVRMCLWTNLQVAKVITRCFVTVCATHGSTVVAPDSPGYPSNRLRLPAIHSLDLTVRFTSRGKKLHPSKPPLRSYRLTFFQLAPRWLSSLEKRAMFLFPVKENSTFVNSLWRTWIRLAQSCKSSS